MGSIDLWDPFFKGFLQNVSHVIQLVYDNCLWFGLIEEYDPPSLTLGSDLDLCCLVIIQLSWLLIRLPSYGAIMIKLRWILGL